MFIYFSLDALPVCYSWWPLFYFVFHMSHAVGLPKVDI